MFSAEVVVWLAAAIIGLHNKVAVLSYVISYSARSTLFSSFRKHVTRICTGKPLKA